MKEPLIQRVYNQKERVESVVLGLCHIFDGLIAVLTLGAYAGNAAFRFFFRDN